jgi:hypothetical protein
MTASKLSADRLTAWQREIAVALDRAGLRGGRWPVAGL